VLISRRSRSSTSAPRANSPADGARSATPLKSLSTDPILDRIDIDSPLDESGREGVTEVMEAEPRDPRLSHGGIECPTRQIHLRPLQLQDLPPSPRHNLLKSCQCVLGNTGIDCPEKDRPFGSEATQMAKQLALEKTVRVTEVGRDKFHRLLGEVVLPDGRMLNRELVREGF